MECNFKPCGDFGDIIEESKKLFDGKVSLRLSGVVYSLFKLSSHTQQLIFSANPAHTQ